MPVPVRPPTRTDAYFDPPWFFYDVTDPRLPTRCRCAMTLDPPRFSPDPQRLAEAITPRTRAVLMNTPAQPDSGRVL